MSVQICWGQRGDDWEQAHNFHPKHTSSVVCQDAPLPQGSVFCPRHCGRSNKGEFLARIKGSWTWSYIREDNVRKNTVLVCGICLSALILAVVLETVRPCSCVPRRFTSSEWWLWLTSAKNAPSISLILAHSVLVHRHAKLQCVSINELELHCCMWHASIFTLHSQRVQISLSWVFLISLIGLMCSRHGLLRIVWHFVWSGKEVFF